MTGDDPPNVGQTDARTYELFGMMQPLKDLEQLVHVAHVEPGSVVPNMEHHLLILAPSSDFNLGLDTGLRVFHGVGHQITQHQQQQSGVALYLGQRTDPPVDDPVACFRSQVATHLLREPFHVGDFPQYLGAAEPGKH